MIAVAPRCARSASARVLENRPIARDTYRLRLEEPALAGSIRPGQFVMIRPGSEGSNDPLLGRPFALYDIVRDETGTPSAIDVVYVVIGKGTMALSQRKPGERLAVWGPLGNGFEPLDSSTDSVVFVAGGIGQTPFLALGRWWLGAESYGVGSDRAALGKSGTGTRRVPDEAEPRAEKTGSQSPFSSSACLLYGVRNKDYLAGVDDFRQAGIGVEIATDDGSAGHHGFVTDLLARRLERGERPSRIVGCGPPAMLAALAKITGQAGVACEVSLENHMACGFGVCFSCVAPIRQPDGSTDLKRVCVEGPIFPAEAVDWAAARH